jgi:hypothetical protein
LSHSFPREDENAPRTIILKKECPGELAAFKDVHILNIISVLSEQRMNQNA